MAFTCARISFAFGSPSRCARAAAAWPSLQAFTSGDWESSSQRYGSTTSTP